jgi:hypothetical protein
MAGAATSPRRWQCYTPLPTLSPLASRAYSSGRLYIRTRLHSPRDRSSLATCTRAVLTRSRPRASRNRRRERTYRPARWTAVRRRLRCSWAAARRVGGGGGSATRGAPGAGWTRRTRPTPASPTATSPTSGPSASPPVSSPIPQRFSPQLPPL